MVACVQHGGCVVLSRSEFQRRALELFQERSFSQVSMRELAAHVGITPGAIYHHIESKEALLFDQDGDHVQLSIPGSFRQLTLSTWIHLDRCDFEMNAIFDSDGWQPGALHWQLKRCGDCFFSHWSKAQRRRNGPRVPFGRWAHVAAVADLDRHWTKIYVNGELAEEARLASFPGPLTPGDCRLGDWLRLPQETAIPRRGLRGRIDEFAIWRRALTRDELHTLFVAGRPTLPSGD